MAPVSGAGSSSDDEFNRWFNDVPLDACPSRLAIPVDYVQMGRNTLSSEQPECLKAENISFALASLIEERRTLEASLLFRDAERLLEAHLPADTVNRFRDAIIKESD